MTTEHHELSAKPTPLQKGGVAINDPLIEDEHGVMAETSVRFAKKKTHPNQTVGDIDLSVSNAPVRDIDDQQHTLLCVELLANVSRVAKVNLCIHPGDARALAGKLERYADRVEHERESTDIPEELEQ